MRTWVRKLDGLDVTNADVLVWVETDHGVFYVLLASGVFKLASIVGHEGMLRNWQPCESSFLELEDAK